MSTPVTLGSIPNHPFTVPQRINHQGHIAGVSVASHSSQGDQGILAWLWNGQMTPLPTLSAGDSAANDINDFDQIVGYSQTPAGSKHACLWDGGHITDLGTLGGGWSEASSLNNHGDVVGKSATRWFGGPLGFLWQNGKMTAIRKPGFWMQQCVATGINSARQVVGNWKPTPKSEKHAFLWEEGNFIDLGTLGAHGARHGISTPGAKSWAAARPAMAKSTRSCGREAV